MKKCYHMTSLNRVRSISNLGLTPRSGENSKVINDNKQKVYFSEGMTGAIALFTDFQKHYDEIKAGNVGKASKEVVEAIQNTSSMEEYLEGDGIYFIFDGSDIQNERNFMNGETSQTIPPENLQVCLLRNNDTGEVSYSRYDIIKYMMSKVPVETINYSGTDIDIDSIDRITAEIQGIVSNYYKEHEQEINHFKFGNYTMETISIKEFCENYLSSKATVSGQDIGKNTMDLLKDVEAVREMEAILDRDVRALELEQESAKESDKIREKKDENQ